MRSIFQFVYRQYSTIKQGGWKKFLAILNRSVQFLIGVIPAFLFLIVMRLIRPFFLIRINRLISLRIGHLAANTEFYLCEINAGINVPEQAYMDISYFGGLRISNKQLAKMWRRKLRVWPKGFMEPLYYMNRLFPGGAVHETENEISEFQFARDIKGFMANTPPSLSFTPKEEMRGREELKKMGIPLDAKFICLIVRDSAYLNALLPHPEQWSYHDYRDSNIQSYVQTADALADLGYYVLRMGEVVNEPIKATNPKVIDYATNGMRSDFMDIYLGANCFFCITVGTGYDAVPMIFRRPMVFVNAVPMSYISTFINNSVSLCKKHRTISDKRMLKLKEIFEYNVGTALHSPAFTAQDVEVVNNSPEEIKSAVFELLQRLTNEWKPEPEDEELQKRFWEIYPTEGRNFYNRRLHGKIYTHYSAAFLRENKEWLS